MTFLLIVLIVLILPVVYDRVYPLQPPYLDNYFVPGQVFSSKMEGLTQKVIRQTGDRVYSEVILAPGSAGPPEHLHLGFNESARVTKGTLTVRLNNESSQVREGNRIYLPKGQYHTFSNPTNDEVILSPEKEDDYLPASFAYALIKFYPILDSTSGVKIVHLLFKASLFGEHFDSYVKEAPLSAQQFLKTVLRPYARVLGYRLYDSRSTPSLSRKKQITG
jgi:quercetin dioxygenase-like cupin family protein